MANPLQVREFFAAAGDRLPDAQLTAHFHNTRGQGLANVLAALEEGVASFESSFGELGGCPVPPGSTGNVSTEDVVSMLHEMGIETGVGLPALIEASRAAQEVARAAARRPRAARRPGGLARGEVGSAHAQRCLPCRRRGKGLLRGRGAVLADDVVFRSPVVYKPYEGLEALKVLLGAVVQVFEDFRYIDQVESGDAAVLVFEARVGDRRAERRRRPPLRATIGLITEMMVMIRPLSGLQALAEAMAERLGVALRVGCALRSD